MQEIHKCQKTLKFILKKNKNLVPKPALNAQKLYDRNGTLHEEYEKEYHEVSRAVTSTIKVLKIVKILLKCSLIQYPILEFLSFISLASL